MGHRSDGIACRTTDHDCPQIHRLDESDMKVKFERVCLECHRIFLMRVKSNANRKQGLKFDTLDWKGIRMVIASHRGS
jgi:hypothetical protein